VPAVASPRDESATGERDVPESISNSALLEQVLEGTNLQRALKLQQFGAAESGGEVRNSIHRTAVYVTRSHGGVGGRSREASSYPDYVAASLR
jgi:hypothetical protein